MTEAAATLLVVDDDEAIRILMRRALGKQGYRVLEAGDAARALEILKAGGVDLVLLDLRMPGPADGEDLLFLLRDRGDEVPIVVVSGWIDEEILEHQPDCVQAMLRKPVQLDELTATVARILNLE